MRTAWMAGLGAGLQSAGQSAMQMLAQAQARKEREDAIRRQEELRKEELQRAQLGTEQQLAQFAFQNNLMPFEDAEAPIKQAERMGNTLSALGGAEIPGGFGAWPTEMGDPLTQLAGKARAQMARGKTLEMPMGDGSTRKYFQPYEKTKEGMEVAAQQRQQQLEQQQRAKSKQALLGANFTEQEADAILDSPENMRGAILDRIRPQAKGQPQEIVGPDGRVTFVQPPALKPGETWDSGLTQRTPPAPGSTPYNWQVVTDPGTGTVYQVDPRTGQVRPTQAPTGEGPFQTTSAAKADAAKARERLRLAITRARDLVNQYGIEVMPGEAQDQLSAAFTNLQLQYKDAAGLGALTGPDMGLVEKALGDPTKITQFLRGGSKGVLAKLSEAERALAGGGGNAPQAMSLTPAEEAFAKNARARGVREADIMAYIREKRGGGGV